MAMAAGNSIPTFPPFISVLLLLLRLISICVVAAVDSDGGGAIFNVKSKFAGMQSPLNLLKAHDNLRHSQILAAGVVVPIGGTGRPDAVGLYYAKIGIGTPSKEYYVQVDTGSDIMWVNCIQCKDCPRRGYHGLELTLYDPEASLTGNMVSCDQNFCLEINGGSVSGCNANASCLYTEVYGDGSYSLGYFVQDIVQYDSVSGDLQTKLANGTVVFGCGARQSGDLGSSDDALDGILGFGKSNSSSISQLASSGKVKKMFAHCLDGVNGGGIFAIGHVVQPKVNSTPLITDQPHYSVNMTGVEVGQNFLNLTTDIFEAGNKKWTIIDSGTTLAYLPEVMYNPLVKEIVAWQSDLRLRTLHDQYTCFDFSGSVPSQMSISALNAMFFDVINCTTSVGTLKYTVHESPFPVIYFSVDDGFPTVTFHFENSLSLKVYPHDYLFPFEDLFCIGWQSNGLESGDRKDMILLGDLVLSSKLVLYDLENHTIGWAEYNCSSSIKVRDEITGSVHLVGPHSLPSGCSPLLARKALLVLLSLIVLLQHFIY